MSLQNPDLTKYFLLRKIEEYAALKAEIEAVQTEVQQTAEHGRSNA